MSLLLYLINTVGSAAVGFLGGILVGRGLRDVHAIAGAVSTTDEPAEPRLPASPAKPEPSRRRAANWLSRISTQVVVGIIVVLLGALTLLQGARQSADTDRLTRCLADYSTEFSGALEARSKASADAQDALDKLINTIASNIASPDHVAGQNITRQAIRDYVNSRARVKQSQQANPYPAPPKARCA